MKTVVETVYEEYFRCVYATLESVKSTPVVQILDSIKQRKEVAHKMYVQPKFLQIFRNFLVLIAVSPFYWTLTVLEFRQ